MMRITRMTGVTRNPLPSTHETPRIYLGLKMWEARSAQVALNRKEVDNIPYLTSYYLTSSYLIFFFFFFFFSYILSL